MKLKTNLVKFWAIGACIFTLGTIFFLFAYIFYHGADTIIGSHTRAQVKPGKYVKADELQRGDCLFFTNEDRQYNTGIERVGHVALYLGNNYILHTASDYARIEKITASRWKFFIEARRFI